MNDKVKCEELFDKKNNLISDEFYYQFYDNKDFNPIWCSGLKKVYDANDKSGNYTIEEAIEYMDEDQENMLMILNKLIGEEIEGERVEYIYVNYLLNEDGTENLLKQIMIVYEINSEDHLVIRMPYYSLSDYALTTYLDEIKKELK